MLPLNDIPACSSRYGIARVKNTAFPRGTFKVIPFHCGKLTCPICRARKRRKLLKRLSLANWSPRVALWTITTDPGVLSPADALSSMNQRWHRVCRFLHRRYPGIRFFRVTEFTQSGLPHMHVLFDRFVDWGWFQSILVAHQFGRVLHFKTLPRHQALVYMTKYITKAFGTHQAARDAGIRMWSASLRFLPAIHYFQDGTEFKIIFTSRCLLEIEQQLSYYEFFQEEGFFP